MSFFDNDSESWAVVNGADGPMHLIAGGNPRGQICAADAGSGIWFWQAPAAFLGDISQYNALTFDLKQSSIGGVNDDDVILVGGGLRLIFNTFVNPVLDWTSYRVPLDDVVSWRIAGSDEEPTIEELRLVLSSVTDLLIRGEYARGDDTGCLDNVTLQFEQPVQAY